MQGAGAGKDDIKHKRAAFRANRHLCGVHALVTLHAAIAHPCGRPGFIDSASLAGQVGIQRTRGGSTLLTEVAMRFGGLTREAAHTPSPLDFESSQAEGVSLLGRFCSKPPPEFSSSVDATGKLVTQVHARALGNKGASTFFLAGVARGIPEPGSPRIMRSQVRVPSEVLIRDVWVHEGIWPGDRVRARAYWRANMSLGTEFRDADELPLRERAAYAGRGLKAAYNPDVPRYPEMIAAVANKLGWDAAALRLYRCRVEYPMLASVLCIEGSGD